LTSLLPVRFSGLLTVIKAPTVYGFCFFRRDPILETNKKQLRKPPKYQPIGSHRLTHTDSRGPIPKNPQYAMIEIRLHGRGGQGAVTSAELLATAAIAQGKYAQAFPSFGPERRGAPVTAFIRIADRPIRIRHMIYQPDLVLVLDPSILRMIDVTAGLKEDGTLVTNTRYDGAALKKTLGITHRLAVVNATQIALEVLGLPITNTTMLGSLLSAKPLIDPAALTGPFQRRFGRLADKNRNAMQRAFQETVMTEGSGRLHQAS
jgi:2-oxoacid:acceptor oxidoreductase gamma subunit (pyruvate/2-ketoisovalerate family)